MAEFLQIELLATFVADATLPALAELPAVRELRAFDQGWQAIDPAQITREIDYAAGRARRRFAASVGSRRIKTSFNVIAGAQAMASLIRADDIVAIIEPTHPGERITRQFTGLLEAAFALAGAVLVVPSRLARTTGPVVTVASDAADPGIRAALEIAAALSERLVVVTAAGAPPPIEFLAAAKQLGVAVGHSAGSGPLAPASARLHERLRVVGRGVWADDVSRLFSSLQGVPLLVIAPGRAEAATEPTTDEDRQARGSGA